MKKSLTFLSLALSLVSVSAFACGSNDRPCEITDCTGSVPGIDSLDLPAAKNTRSFYDGQVNVFNIDHDEPAVQSAALLILMPSVDEGPYDPRCFEVGNFGHVDVNEIKTSYDPSKGLLLTIPYWNWDVTGTQTDRIHAIVKVRLNVQKGTALEE